jgi:GTP pyrophosphokinase
MPHTIEAISDQEKKQATRVYRRLMKPLKVKLKGNDEQNLNKAFDLALKAHAFQRRKSGEPYIFHPIEVARICHEEIGLGPTAIICAILHDVVEDTAVTLEEIEEMFGTKVTKIVDGLTKLDGLYNIEQSQAQNLKKVLSTLVEDVRVVLIKMADRLHNMRTIGPMPRHKQLKISAETKYIYIPLAHRLGLYNVKTEFEDICMKISDFDSYSEINQKLQESNAERKRYIREFIRPIKQKLAESGIPYRVIGRPKSISSIWNKIKTKQVPFEEIYDIFAVRIIVDVPFKQEKTASWQVYSIITDVFKPIPERLKDWITTPKGNGYESLHTTVIGPKGRFVEVQIRTERMDEIAERGFAAHWKYKSGDERKNVYDTWLENIRDILDTQHNSAFEFINDFRTNLFSEEVYVFTPKGDMKILPKGATALDFAFAIHSDVGYHTTAIKVNNKIVPMGYKLNNGDQIKIVTSKNQKPREDWLKMVITGKARSKIRSSMKEEQKKLGEFGKESLQRKLKKLKIDFEENVDFIVKNLGFKSRPDLFFAITTENIKLTELKKFDIENGKFKLKEEAKETNGAPEKKVVAKRKSALKINASQILVNGESADQYEFTFARCCNPVQGDDIFAYLTAAAGLKIHRTSCPNATHLMANYGYRIMKAEWVGTTASNFVVDLKVTGIDSGPGVITNLTSEISNKMGINIRSFSIEGDEGYFEGKISIVVINKNQLNLVIRNLKKLDGISSVSRLDKYSLN